MQQQSLDHAIPTRHLLSCLEDEPKFSLTDALSSAAQIAGALSLCWMIHVIV